MNEIRFDHLHFKSASPETSAQFYADGFGASIVSRENINGRLRVVLELSGIRFFIEEKHEAAADAPRAPYSGVEHFGLLVTDIAALAARLRGMGVSFAVEPRASRPGMKVAFFYGPDGEYIELIERAPA